MKKRLISPKSLKNLYQSNKESNRLTRESIETALLFLLEQKELKKISIAELARKAGVSRNAVYRNYKSKEEILEAYYKHASSSVSKKWQHMHSKLKQEGIVQPLSNFLEKKKEQLPVTKTFSNISQWIKERSKSN